MIHARESLQGYKRRKPRKTEGTSWIHGQPKSRPPGNQSLTDSGGTRARGPKKTGSISKRFLHRFAHAACADLQMLPWGAPSTGTHRSVLYLVDLPFLQNGRKQENNSATQLFP